MKRPLSIIKVTLLLLSLLDLGAPLNVADSEVLQSAPTAEISSNTNPDVDIILTKTTTAVPSQNSTDINVFQTETLLFQNVTDMDGTADPAEQEKQVKEQIRRLLNRWNQTRGDAKVGFSETTLTAFRSLLREEKRSAPPPLVRTDIRLLSWRQWIEFCEAMRRISTDRPDPSRPDTWFDVFSGYYRSSESPSAHGGAGFISWHSRYILSLENALRRINPNVRLPIWDPRPDTQIPNHCDSCLFTADLIGNAHGQVNAGPFRNRIVYSNSCQGSLYGYLLSRNCYDFYGRYTLMSYEYVQNVQNNYAGYSDFVSPYNPSFEQSYGGLHLAVGGHLSLLSCAANDPLFYMLYGFTQAIFDIAMDNHYTYEQQVQLPYPSGANIYPIYSGYTQALPFDVTLSEALRYSMASNLHYNFLPSSCWTDSQCNPTFSDMNAYWCKTWTGRCASKIRIGGRCRGSDGLYPNQACFKESFCVSDPFCYNDYCMCTNAFGGLVSTPSAY